jgi:hypothetical protein
VLFEERPDALVEVGFDAVRGGWSAHCAPPGRIR